MTYDAFVLHAFTNYGISNELLNTVRPWVEKELDLREYAASYSNRPMKLSSAHDLGYSELADITTVDQGMQKIKECIWMATTMDTEKKTEKAKQKYYKDAGGRIGKGIYRIVLKTYYLALKTT